LRYNFPARASYACGKPSKSNVFFDNLNGSFGDHQSIPQETQTHPNNDSFDVLTLRVISKKQKTGFSDYKDFPIQEGTLIAGTFEVI
jgi:hypothetical protein